MKKINYKETTSSINFNPIMESIYEYIDDFNLKFDKTKETFKKATLSTSDRKENIVKDFFSSFFPSNYSISRGEIFDYNNISNSIDCVIKSPEHPNLKTPLRPEIILADGVYAAIEVKPDISIKKELLRGLKQCQSVKKLERTFSIKRLEQLDKLESYKKIPFILFSDKAKDIEKTLKSIIEKVEEGIFKCDELPDIIFSLDGWMIYHTINIKTSLFYDTFRGENIPDDSSSVFMLFKGDVNNLMCVMLMLLFKFPGHGYVINDYIINIYLEKMYNEGIIRFSRAIWYE